MFTGAREKGEREREREGGSKRALSFFVLSSTGIDVRIVFPPAYMSNSTGSRTLLGPKTGTFDFVIARLPDQVFFVY